MAMNLVLGVGPRERTTTPSIYSPPRTTAPTTHSGLHRSIPRARISFLTANLRVKDYCLSLDNASSASSAKLALGSRASVFRQATISSSVINFRSHTCPSRASRLFATSPLFTLRGRCFRKPALTAALARVLSGTFVPRGPPLVSVRAMEYAKFRRASPNCASPLLVRVSERVSSFKLVMFLALNFHHASKNIILGKDCGKLVER